MGGESRAYAAVRKTGLGGGEGVGACRQRERAQQQGFGGERGSG